MTARAVSVGSLTRTYWIAAPPSPPAGLIVALHGLGMTGRDMAWLTHLAARAPAAGFAAAFPDAFEHAWDALGGLPRRDGIDDCAFVRALVADLRAEGFARPAGLVLVGLSNGALFAEHLARHRILDVAGIVLVAGTATKASRDTSPVPAQRSSVLIFAGTADPVMPYDGGPIGGSGLVGRITRRRATERGEAGDRRVAVGVETLAGDWALADGAGQGPVVERFSEVGRGPRVDRLRWSTSGATSVVVYRIEGGGHHWPGAPRVLPARLIGPSAEGLDATGILLDAARRWLGTDDGPTK